MLQVASGDSRPCSRQTEGSGLSPSVCRFFRKVVVISVVVISLVWLLSSLSTRRWGNDHRLLFVTAASSSSPFSVVSSSRPTCPLSVLRVVSRMRGPLLGRAAVFYVLLALSISLAGAHQCPRSLDCARAGRHFCQPGSSHCGPCLHPLVENAHGQCVVKRRHISHSAQSIKGKSSTYPELDEEIDFLSAVITEQKTESRLPVADFQHASKPKSPSGTAGTEQPVSQNITFTSVAPPTSSTNHSPTLISDPIILPYPSDDNVFIIMSSVFIVAGSMALVIAGACWVRLQRGVSLTQKIDFPAYGMMKAPTFDNLPGDKKLAQSAQMYHYQHQKQQMLSLGKHTNEPRVPDSGASTDEENEDGDFTVYECPGLAPTGEMEVKNPLFDDSTLYFQRFHK